MKTSPVVLLLLAAGLVHGLLCPATLASPRAASPYAVVQSTQDSDSSARVDPEQSSDSVTIPGPLRSFLRMSAVGQEVPPKEILPALAHNAVLLGYEKGRAKEYLILLRRYVHQSLELNALVDSEGNIRVSGCEDSSRLLHILGYKISGECGTSGMTLITADADRAFLTVDSGFPFLTLEDSLKRGTPFVYGYKGTSVPLLFKNGDWTNLGANSSHASYNVLDTLLYEREVARLYWAMSRIEPETRAEMEKEIGLAKLLPNAPVLDLYGSQISIRNGAVVVPGGQAAENQWQEMAGANPQKPAVFIPALLTKDNGWLAAYFDAMERLSPQQRDHFAANERLKRYYAAFTSMGLDPNAGARLPFRPSPAVMVLAARVQWDENGDPYVPGDLQTWGRILHDDPDRKSFPDWAKHGTNWKRPDQLAEAMFAFSRQETDDGPLQAYLFLSELDSRRGPGRRLSDKAVYTLARNYADFGDQYLIFSEFPELSEDSILRFVSTAQAIGVISDHTVRGNGMGIFQANVGIWQILARQGEIPSASLDSSWEAMIKPFSKASTASQIVTAGRSSLVQVVLAATGKSEVTEDGVINLLAGAPQLAPEAQQIHLEFAGRIHSVIDDQRLVSIDTLFALDDGLRDPAKLAADRDRMAALAAQLREFEMPQPIFSQSERYEWAAGTYNNRHTDLQMHTDLVKIIRSSSSPEQLDMARGQLATFLRDSLVGLNYAYYEPPGSQVLHHNPLFVRSHDFSGETVIGIQHLWQAPSLFGVGSPAGGGAHLVGSIADLPYVLAVTEEDFIAPTHVQALIWRQFVPGVLTNAVITRWWNVSRNELHAVALYQRAGEELLVASSNDDTLRRSALDVLSDRMSPERLAWLGQSIEQGDRDGILDQIAPADSFYLAAEFRRRYPDKFETVSASGRELDALYASDPGDVNWDRLSRDFGVVHPVFAQTYARELINVRPFPALAGNYSRLMSECWDSGNLYWARLADEMGYSPVLLNRVAPALTRRMVERIFASDIEDLPATLRALRETGEEFRRGKISLQAENTGGGK